MKYRLKPLLSSIFVLVFVSHIIIWLVPFSISYPTEYANQWGPLSGKLCWFRYQIFQCDSASYGGEFSFWDPWPSSYYSPGGKSTIIWFSCRYGGPLEYFGLLPVEGSNCENPKRVMDI